MFLCDVPTPALVLDHSTASMSRGLTASALDEILNIDGGGDEHPLADLIYIHTSVLSGRESTTAVGQTTLSGVADGSERVVLARIDASLDDAGG